MITQRSRRTTSAAAGLLSLALLAALSGCSDGAGASAKPHDPFTKEPVAGTELVRIRMEPAAVARARIATVQAGGPVTIDGTALAGTVPYAALLYEPDGSTFVYMNPEPDVYVRHPVTVDRIVAGVVYFSAGPAAGHAVVTDGAAELMGAEFGVGK